MAANLSLNLNQFAFNLYNKMTTGKNENFFISPFSISTALAMTLVGARTNTASQLKEVLSLSELKDEEILKMYNDLLGGLNKLASDGQIQLNTANKIYPHEKFSIKNDYVDLITKNFHSEVQRLNYSNASESAKTINNWVSNQTKNKINDLIPQTALNDLTRLVLVNAIYFKANWLHKFNNEQTYKEDFHLADGSVNKVDMMKLLNKKFKFQINPAGLKALSCEFPYVGNSVSMTIILPHEGVSIESVEGQLSSSVLNELLTARVSSGKVHAYVPKFKLSYENELSGFLKAMGAPLAFDEAKADFTGISDISSGLYISKVIHKAIVEVNEEGSEAAAATGVIMMTRCAVIESPPEEFKCNRPFLFLIHDNNNKSILFLGKYMKPE